jgi:hypothetical protein
MCTNPNGCTVGGKCASNVRTRARVEAPTKDAIGKVSAPSRTVVRPWGTDGRDGNALVDERDRINPLNVSRNGIVTP